MSEITDYTGETPKALKKIDPSDLKFNPMQLNKTFYMYSGSSDKYTPLQAYYTNIVPQNYITGEQNLDGTFKSIIYKSVDQLFYKYNTDDSIILYTTTSIFSIPQKKLGQRIKNDSFTYSSASLNLASYKNGKIYDSNMITSSFPIGLMYYEGFNEYFDSNRINTSEIYNLNIVNGVTTTNGQQKPIGLSAKFNGTTSHIIKDIDGYYNKQEDYAISFFISGTNSTNLDQLVLGKLSTTDQQYPFKINLSGSNELKFSFADGVTNKFISSSADVSGSWTHVVCQKTGSTLEMYLDGTKHASETFNMLDNNLNSYVNNPKNISNSSSLKIGGYSSNSSNLQGYLDEIRIYNNALTTSQISTLKDRTEGGGLLQTNIVGNIFSSKGFINISTPDYRFDNLITSKYTASYQSTITLYELSSLCRVDAGDYNVTQNVSALDENNQQYLNYMTGSNFSPYITTIGLYNGSGELLVVGKLGQPIKKRSDVDINFLVRLDLDMKTPSMPVTDTIIDSGKPTTTSTSDASSLKDGSGGQSNYLVTR